jgi:hypothetical protein
MGGEICPLRNRLNMNAPAASCSCVEALEIKQLLKLEFSGFMATGLDRRRSCL